MSQGRLLEEIGTTEFAGWVQYLLEPTKEDYYSAQIAWRLYVLEIRFCGLPKGERIRSFKDFFLDRMLPKNKEGKQVEDEYVPEETEEEIRERKKQKIAEAAKLAVMIRFGIPPPEDK